MAVLSVGSGSYEFSAASGVADASVALKTSKPKDTSINPDGIDLTGAKQLIRWNFTKPEDVAKWIERKSVDIVQRGGKAYVVATGDDSQMAAQLNKEASGRLVIELRAMPSKGATSQFFWASPGRGFNGIQQSQRPLMASEQMNLYLFSIQGTGPVMKLRFDPFATYDEHANKGEMQVESIAVYRLQD